MRRRAGSRGLSTTLKPCSNRLYWASGKQLKSGSDSSTPDASGRGAKLRNVLDWRNYDERPKRRRGREHVYWQSRLRVSRLPGRQQSRVPFAVSGFRKMADVIIYIALLVTGISGGRQVQFGLDTFSHVD